MLLARRNLFRDRTRFALSVLGVAVSIGIAIVEVGGKSNLPLAARLLRQLEIPFVIVFDADRGAASAALDAEIRRAAGPAPVIRLAPDFEAAAGIRPHGIGRADPARPADHRERHDRTPLVGRRTAGGVADPRLRRRQRAPVASLSQPALRYCSPPTHPQPAPSWRQGRIHQP